MLGKKKATALILMHALICKKKDKDRRHHLDIHTGQCCLSRGSKLRFKINCIKRSPSKISPEGFPNWILACTCCVRRVSELGSFCTGCSGSRTRLCAAGPHGAECNFLTYIISILLLLISILLLFRSSRSSIVFCCFSTIYLFLLFFLFSSSTTLYQ